MKIELVESADGGVGICFFEGKKLYGDIEFQDNGEILAVTSDGTGHPTAWEVEPAKIAESIRRIRDFLLAESSLSRKLTIREIEEEGDWNTDDGLPPPGKK